MFHNKTYHQNPTIIPTYQQPNFLTNPYKNNQNHYHNPNFIPNPTYINPQQKQTKQQIIDLENHLHTIHQEICQIQNMLSYRDVLYHQLQHLQVERQNIQDSILTINAKSQAIHKSKSHSSHGLKQINKRLKRRIKQMGEYINKMDTENNKLQRSINNNYQPPQIHTYPIFPKYYKTTPNPNLIQPFFYESKHTNYEFNDEYFEKFRKEIQQKENNSWKRIQQQKINRETNILDNIGNRTAQNNMYSKYKRKAY